MSKTPNAKTKWLHLRLSEAEHAQLTRQFSKTTERKISSYARKILLGKPLIGGYRNLTTEGLITEFSNLIKVLNGIANNYNQAIHVLHTLKRSSEFSRWFLRYESDRNKLMFEVKAMRDFMDEKAEIWLRS
jgi:hypothetical protein